MLWLRQMRLRTLVNQPYTTAYTQTQLWHRAMQTTNAVTSKRSSQITEFAQRQLGEDVIDFSAGQVRCKVAGNGDLMVLH